MDDPARRETEAPAIKRSIRRSAFLMVLLPTLFTALALSGWYTARRVGDARAELEARGSREAAYLAGASELAFLVGDDAALRRLAESNLRAAGAPRAALFLDPQGALLAAAGSPWEIGLAQQCWRGAADCSGGEARRVFSGEVRGRAESNELEAFDAAAATAPSSRASLIGHVVLSFDPRVLASLQRTLLLNAALVTLAALVVASLLANLAASRLSTPIQQLSRVVSRIRAGDLAARTRPRGTGELRQLEEGVNAMADRVEEASAELNRKVDEAVAELSLTMADLEQRNREKDEALARAEAASRAKDMFLARMSHELRTPLSTVTGYARLMQQSGSPEQRAEYYRPIRQASEILRRTVDDVLDFVKLESGAMPLERREFDLEDCIEDTVMMLAPGAHAKGLALVCHLAAGVPARVLGDSVRISQVLSNLLSNAVKFTEHGSVGVRVRAGEAQAGVARVCIEVEDTGIGIPAGTVAQLFQPFAQADESMTRRFGGSGLGLSISSRIVSALGGTINLASEPGRGTQARVELPLQLPGEDAEDSAVGRGLTDRRIALRAGEAHPQLPVLCDYLARAGALLQMISPLSPWPLPGEQDLLLVLDPGDTPPPALTSPVLRLRAVRAGAGEGDASAESTDPEEIALPLRRRELLAACARRLAETQPFAPTTSTMPLRPRFALRVLLVEDNELNRRMLATGLADLGIEVLEAPGGTEALALAEREGVDLVLLDVHMPGMDGISLARELRRRDPVLPLYALTANVIGSEEAALSEAGVADVLYKPLEEDRLLALLARHDTPLEVQLQETELISREEFVQESRQLERLTARSLAAGDLFAARESAHQLLGLARLFCTGELGEHCLALEKAVIAGEREEAFRQLACVRRAFPVLLGEGHAHAPSADAPLVTG